MAIADNATAMDGDCFPDNSKYITSKSQKATVLSGQVQPRLISVIDHLINPFKRAGLFHSKLKIAGVDGVKG